MIAALPLWRREGVLVTVQPDHAWWASHAQLPAVLEMPDRLWRVYFGARDRDNRSRMMAVDIDPGDNMRVVREHFHAMLEPGPVGAFDHGGASPSSALWVDGRVYLYYIGVSERRDVRGQTAIGVAFSKDGLHFSKAFSGPVHGVGQRDPYFTSAPVVRREGAGYRMWYVSGTEWRSAGDRPEPFYEIRTTSSPDGLVWNPRSEAVLALQAPSAGYGRPWLAEWQAGLRLWFSVRGEAYREPGDGAYRLASVLADERGTITGPSQPIVWENPPGSGDFDSWMQAYACVVPNGDDLIMLYNGNDFGRKGFGWARLHGGAGCANPSSIAPRQTGTEDVT